MSSSNIEMMQTVAKGLGKLKDEVAFVGGAVAELLKNDNLTEGIESALPYGSASERTEKVEEIIKSIAVNL